VGAHDCHLCRYQWPTLVAETNEEPQPIPRGRAVLFRLLRP
jgi:hypothetical protein